MANDISLEKKIKSEVESYFDHQIACVNIPPAPPWSFRDYRMDRDKKKMREPLPSRHRTGFYLSRAAFVAILILCGAASFSLVKNQNHMAEIITRISEQENLEIKIISGLQKAGRFLYANL